jgi:ATP-binding cassette subfamily B protein
LAAAVVGIVAGAALPLVMRTVVDNAVARSTHHLAELVCLLLVIALVGFAAGSVRWYLGGRLSLDVQYDLRRAVYSAAMKFDGHQQDSTRTGQRAPGR